MRPPYCPFLDMRDVGNCVKYYNWTTTARTSVRAEGGLWPNGRIVYTRDCWKTRICRTGTCSTAYYNTMRNILRSPHTASVQSPVNHHTQDKKQLAAVCTWWLYFVYYCPTMMHSESPIRCMYKAHCTTQGFSSWYIKLLCAWGFQLRWDDVWCIEVKARIISDVCAQTDGRLTAVLLRVLLYCCYDAHRTHSSSSNRLAISNKQPIRVWLCMII